eukprot:TRINITY_DN1100_c5_g1_i1.p1 TRINITY_DN1100_c5_g1~~TRINITY_DN1100_c5_g1_i1.p1  ORF type:complete len:784 (+),score=264.05 TRINITY_DN1100_c5_g1_i1:266-2353(+)
MNMAAIYFMEPKKICVQHLLDDFKDTKTARYTSVHLFFTTHCGNNLMQMIEANSVLTDRIKTLQEMYCDFVAFESRVFSLNRPKALSRLYLKNKEKLYLKESGDDEIDPEEDITKEIKYSARQLASLCLTLNEYPYVRYSSNAAAKQLATNVEEEMKSLLRSSTDWKHKSARGVLLIVDRAVDAIAPIIHEFTYQSFVYDTIKTDGESAFVELSGAQTEEEKKNAELKTDEKKKLPSSVVLSEDDHLWTAYRHLHIALVLEDITKRYKEFVGTNATAKMQKNKNKDQDLSPSDLAQAMRDFPKYKDMIRMLQKHWVLSQTCMDDLNNKKLDEIGDLEQTIATGMKDDGKETSTKDLAKLLQNFHKSTATIIERMRLYMIYLASVGPFQEAFRQEVLEPIPADLVQALFHLERMGIKVQADTKSKKEEKRLTAERISEFKKRAKEAPLTLMRYVPALKRMMEKLCEGKLDEEEYPYVTPPADDNAIPTVGSGSGGERRATFSSSSSSASSKSAKSARSTTASSHAKKVWRKGSDLSRKETKDDDDSSSSSSSSSSFDAVPFFIIFVMGGVSYSEMRSVYEVSQATGAQIIIGGSVPLSPEAFLKGMAGIDPEIDLKEYIDPKKRTRILQEAKKEKEKKKDTADEETDSSSSSSSSSKPTKTSSSSSSSTTTKKKPTKKTDDKPVVTKSFADFDINI